MDLSPGMDTLEIVAQVIASGKVARISCVGLRTANADAGPSVGQATGDV